MTHIEKLDGCPALINSQEMCFLKAFQNAVSRGYNDATLFPYWCHPFQYSKHLTSGMDTTMSISITGLFLQIFNTQNISIHTLILQ